MQIASMQKNVTAKNSNFSASMRFASMQIASLNLAFSFSMVSRNKKNTKGGRNASPPIAKEGDRQESQQSSRQGTSSLPVVDPRQRIQSPLPVVDPRQCIQPPLPPVDPADMHDGDASRVMVELQRAIVRNGQLNVEIAPASAEMDQMHNFKVRSLTK